MIFLLYFLNYHLLTHNSDYIYMKYLINQHASVGIAVSKQSARSLFGPNWKADPRWRIIYCGIDVDLFNKYPKFGLDFIIIKN